MKIANMLRLAISLSFAVLAFPIPSAARQQNPDIESRQQSQRRGQRPGTDADLAPNHPAPPSRPPGYSTPPRPAPGTPPRAPKPPVAHPHGAPPHGAPPHYIGQPRPGYYFRPGDRERMRRYYARNFGYIDRGRRPRFMIGAYIPFGYRGYLRLVPSALLGYLPAPPPGYVLGYFQGYLVVYNPRTFTILNVMDLLS
jgi:hypothetical protein